MKCTAVAPTGCQSEHLEGCSDQPTYADDTPAIDAAAAAKAGGKGGWEGVDAPPRVGVARPEAVPGRETRCNIDCKSVQCVNSVYMQERTNIWSGKTGSEHNGGLPVARQPITMARTQTSTACSCADNCHHNADVPGASALPFHQSVAIPHA
jgi:hypothetical protein